MLSCGSCPIQQNQRIIAFKLDFDDPREHSALAIVGELACYGIALPLFVELNVSTSPSSIAQFPNVLLRGKEIVNARGWSR